MYIVATSPTEVSLVVLIQNVAHHSQVHGVLVVLVESRSLIESVQITLPHHLSRSLSVQVLGLILDETPVVQDAWV